jgi:hypothetical protein
MLVHLEQQLLDGARDVGSGTFVSYGQVVQAWL